MAAWPAFAVLVLFVAVASACEDDPTFLFKNKEGKTCTWVSGAKNKKRLCKRRKINTACPVTCKTCRSECPKKKRNMIKLYEKTKKCNNFEAGIRCYYDSEFYECDDSKHWVFGVDPPIHLDPPVDIMPITICPDTEKEMKELYEERSCGGYQVGLRCSYKSSPNKFYECDSSGQWLMGISEPEPDPPIHLDPPVDIMPITICPETEMEMKELYDKGSCGGYQVGLRCNYKSSPNLFYDCDASGQWLMGVSDPEPPIHLDPITICPDSEEEMKELYEIGSCGGYQVGLRCSYNYVYMGCNAADIQCSPTNFYVCDASEKWELEVHSPLPCVGDGDEILSGKSCDPERCPPIEPKAGSSCSWYQGNKKDSCVYDYKYLGCTPETLACVPTSSLHCGEKDVWVDDGLVFIECAANDERWDTKCEPE